MRRSYLLAVFGIALSVASIALAEDEPKEKSKEEPNVEVQLTQIKKGSLPKTVTAYGRVEPSTSALRTVMAPAATVVDQIYVRQGQEVDTNAPLLRLVPSPATQFAYAQAESAQRVASDLVARTRNMVQQHLATAQQLADAEKSQTDAKASLVALQAQGAGGANTLKAPFRAVVTAIATSPGAIVAEGAPLLSLAGPGEIVLKAGIIPAEAGAIAADDPATIKAVGQNDSETGKVVLRGAMVDAASGTIPIEIALPAGKFLPGQAAVATITTGEVTGYIVPHAAILVDDQGHRYVVQAANMTAKRVPVRVLDAAGDQDVVEGALDASAPLVLGGNYQLKDGMKMHAGEAVDPRSP
ncbi:MAG TPA: HlyD family efflux transporter periplasmic adaptor subunit [Stellaceae bacterium]|jgi:RND family efflux transporter MFP subunit|nr:HlyD family efflux transporter periplasmic adaptor subunit [Stellaceae bacterium]